jgi:hypothetical protein
MVQGIEILRKVQDKARNGFRIKNRTAQLISKLDNIPGKAYSFLSKYNNPEYEAGIRRLPFESCLYTPNGSKKKAQNTPNEVFVKTKPKWFTDLMEWEIIPESGEVLAKGVYTTNDFKRSNNSKIKALDRFCEKYQPLYAERKVTLFFLTFTRANFARLTWHTMSKLVMQYFKRLGMDVLGHVWTAEISESLHWHYHICVSTKRVDFRKSGIPEGLKFEDLWGQRTEIDFVKKNIRHYMAKYFAKHNARAVGRKSYGISRKLKTI